MCVIFDFKDPRLILSLASVFNCCVLFRMLLIWEGDMYMFILNLNHPDGAFAI